MNEEQHVDIEDWIRLLYEAFFKGKWLDDPSDMKYQFFFWGFVVLLGGMGLMLRRLHNARFEMSNMRKKELITESKIAILEKKARKNQLDPHTLKNMFKSFTELSKTMYYGASNLNTCLEYVLYGAEEELVSIKQEVEFLKSYVEYRKNMEQLFGKIDIDYTKLDETSSLYNKPAIPHQVIIYLVENAFKHGDKSQDDFLSIKLILEQLVFRVEVVNRIGNNKNNVPGGIGLENMKKRLDVDLTGRFTHDYRIENNKYIANLQINFNEQDQTRNS